MFLHEEAQDVIGQSDALVVVLNVDEDSMSQLEQIISLAVDSRKPWIAVIHKTDLPQLHTTTQILRERLIAYKVPVVQGQLCMKVVICCVDFEHLKNLLPESDGPLYDEELYTLSSVNELSGEIVREKCFEKLHQEVPFGLAVRS